MVERVRANTFLRWIVRVCVRERESTSLIRTQGGLLSLTDTAHTDAETDLKTAEVALAVGIANNGICSSGVAPDARFTIYVTEV